VTFAVARDPVTRFEAARRAARASKHRQLLIGGIVLGAAFALSAHVAEIEPRKLLDGLPMTVGYVARTMPELGWSTLGADLAEWFWGWRRWLRMLFDTLVMAFLGTLIGACLAVAASFLAARTLSPHPMVFFFTRRGLEIARSVPELVYALIFVFAFGLGPLPGVLAIAVHSLGALGKLFAEANENADLRPLDGVRAAGANWAQAMRFAVLPQVLPDMASWALLRFEINVRAAAILGFVGAGGIGIELYTVVRQFLYTDISALILLIMATVMLIDQLCERLRHRVIRLEAAQ
jgi:phosphonate transport system permease protein